jgi:hypothetical protein
VTPLRSLATGLIRRSAACAGLPLDEFAKGKALRKNKSVPALMVDNSHLDNQLDEALRETFPASDPIAITIDRPIPAEVTRGSKVVAAPLATRTSVLIAGAEPEAKTGTEGQSPTGPFNAMLWGPIQFFNWWALLMVSRGAGHSSLK